MSPSYFEMSQKGGKTETGHELIRINELRSGGCTPESEHLISESLKRINLSVPEGVSITDWGAIDRIQILVYIARNQDDIPKLRQALGDIERVVKRQVAELVTNDLTGFEWDDGCEPLAKINEKSGLVTP